MIRVGAAAFALLVLGKRCVRRAGTNSGGATHAAKEHDMLVDVGGHKLEMVSAGTKGPTVVLESGFGATSDFWEKVQHGASEFAVVVSYDRAGVGKSELAASPRTALNIAQELHSALHAGQFAPPNVLVGHSIGSFYIRVFAHTYPREVCGMVCVDPVSEDFYEWMRTHQPEDWKQVEAASSQLPEGLRNELARKDESAEQARQAWPLPKVPTILITATKPIAAILYAHVVPKSLRSQEVGKSERVRASPYFRDFSEGPTFIFRTAWRLRAVLTQSLPRTRSNCGISGKLFTASAVKGQKRKSPELLGRRSANAAKTKSERLVGLAAESSQNAKLSEN